MIRDDRGRRALVLALVLTGLWLTWVMVAAFVVPIIIGQAYRAESLPLINRIISGQESRALDVYLSSWRGLAVWSSLALLGTAAAVVVGDYYRRTIREKAGRILQPLLVRSAHEPAWLPLLGVTCGLVTGLIEAAYMGIRNIGSPTGEFYWEMLWMIPSAGAIGFGLLGVVLSFVLWPTRRWRVVELAPFVLVVLVAYNLVRAVASRLHIYAVAILAVGLAIHITLRMARSRATRPLMTKSAVLMGSLILLIATGGWAVGAGAAWWANAKLGEASREAPNVLLIILDTVRAKNLSVYGYARRTTPELEMIARDGAVFDRAIAPTPWTLPSHASMFTGRESWELSTDFVVPLDETQPTLAEVLRSRGYRTAGFVANLFFTSEPSGLARGFDHYEDQPWTVSSLIGSARVTRVLQDRWMLLTGRRGRLVYKTAEDVTNDFLRWLPDPDERPFFAFLNYIDAHDPYDPPASFERRFSDPAGRYWVSHYEKYSPDELRQLEAAYDDAIAYVDQELGRLFRELEGRGVLQNTLVVVTSDHGEQFGEQTPDLVKHSQSLYLQALHVPLIVYAPGRVPAGVRVPDPVGIRRLPSTIMELAGLAAHDVFPGPSLVPMWSDVVPGSPRRPVLSALTVNPRERFPESIPISKGPMQSILSDTLHLIRNGDGGLELYHVLRDPDEQTDLSEEADYRASRDRLWAMLEAGGGVASTGDTERFRLGRAGSVPARIPRK